MDDEIKEYYQKNPDFKRYVDRYCKHYGYDLKEALSHSLIHTAMEYYQEQELIMLSTED